MSFSRSSWAAKLSVIVVIFCLPATALAAGDDGSQTQKDPAVAFPAAVAGFPFSVSRADFARRCVLAGAAVEQFPNDTQTLGCTGPALDVGAALGAPVKYVLGEFCGNSLCATTVVFSVSSAGKATSIAKKYLGRYGRGEQQAVAGRGCGTGGAAFRHMWTWRKPAMSAMTLGTHCIGGESVALVKYQNHVQLQGQVERYLAAQKSW